jgi:hypothetical protein
MCDLNVVENEFHFILQCSKYVQLRRKYIKSIIGLGLRH